MSNVGELLRDGHRCNRGGPLWRKFIEFHNQNPWVYDRLKHHCNELRTKGFRKYSTRTLIAVLRFEWDLKTTHQEVRTADGETIKVKLNDHHSAYYARMLIEDFPHMWDFFELRYAEGDPFKEDGLPELEPEPDPEPVWDGVQRAMF